MENCSLTKIEIAQLEQIYQIHISDSFQTLTIISTMFLIIIGIVFLISPFKFEYFNFMILIFFWFIAAGLFGFSLLGFKVVNKYNKKEKKLRMDLKEKNFQSQNLKKELNIMKNFRKNFFLLVEYNIEKMNPQEHLNT